MIRGRRLSCANPEVDAEARRLRKATSLSRSKVYRRHFGALDQGLKKSARDRFRLSHLGHSVRTALSAERASLV
jgi:hypothetical protein